MRPAAAVALVAFALAAASPASQAAPRRPAAKGCPSEIGAGPAADLVEECRQVRDGRGACRPDRSCEALRDEIRQGCEEAGGDPAVCASRTGDDEDE